VVAVVTGSRQYTAFLKRERGGGEHWVLSTKGEYPGLNEGIPKTFGAALSIMGGVSV
jgi:hypothetical protein